MMKTILASVYAVNPYKGSEDGTGWNFILQIARYNKIIAITRENNQDEIDRYINENPQMDFSNIRFIYFDLPYWARFWKRGARGAMLYYFLWQYFLPLKILKLNLKFDISHNINFHNDWTPTWLYKLKKPVVWGPIGHHPQLPKWSYTKMSFKEKLSEKLRNTIKNYFWNYSLALKKSAKNAAAILAMNSSVKLLKPFRNSKIQILSQVAAVRPLIIRYEKNSHFTVLSVGRFVALKAIDVAIDSFIVFYNKLNEKEKLLVSMNIIGKGPLKNAYKQRIKQKGLENIIKIIAWMPQKKLFETYAQSSVFLFPSHEGAGMVVAEALSYGLPVICYDNIGPGELIGENGGIKISDMDKEKSIVKFADNLTDLFLNKEKLSKLSSSAISHFNSNLTWNKKGEILKKVYADL